MKRHNLLILLFVVFVSLSPSCTPTINDKLTSCEDFDLDIAYSISYSKDSTRAQVCFSDASTNIPSESYVEVYLSGAKYNNNDCPDIDNNGQYTIILSTDIDGTQCSTTEKFDITALK